MIGRCAKERGITTENEQFREWLISQRLIDPEHVFPAVEQAFAELVGDANWLFDRAVVLQTLA